MEKEYTVIHPDIEPARGRTRELIDELVSSFRNGTNEGGGDIAALASLLSSEAALPYIYYMPRAEGELNQLAQEFAHFIMEGGDAARQLAANCLGDPEGLLMFVGYIGSATAGIYALLERAGVSGGEVITSSLNYIGVANAIVLAGATPRFVDVDQRTWCMDPAGVEKAINKKTRAVVLTHLNRFTDITPYSEMFKRRGIEMPLIQDASLAVGSTFNGARPGLVNIGKGGGTVFSLATSKVISGLGGAMVTTNSADVLAGVLATGYQGVDFTARDRFLPHGANMKMNDMNAAIARQHLKRRDELFAKRRRLKKLYDQALAPAVEKGAVVLQEVGEEAVVTHYGLLVNNREKIAQQLYERYRIHLGRWHVLHLLGPFKFAKVSLPFSESIPGRIAFLPFHTRLSDDDAQFICEKFLETVG